MRLKLVLTAILIIIFATLISIYNWKDGQYQDEKTSRQEYQRLYTQCDAEFEKAREDWDLLTNDYDARLKESRPVETKVKQNTQTQIIYVTKEVTKDSSSDRKIELIDEVLRQEWK